MPASCQSRNRRQQVMPEPQPSSCDSISHGMPLRSAKRIPVKQARSGKRGLPPFGLRCCHPHRGPRQNQTDTRFSHNYRAELRSSLRARPPYLGPSMVGSASVSVVGLCDVESPHFVLQRCALQPETFRSRSRTGDSSRCRFQRLNDHLPLRVLERGYGSGISDG
jgi:hypothetical protein